MAKKRMIPCSGPHDAPKDLFPPMKAVERLMYAFDQWQKYHDRWGDGKKRTRKQMEKLHEHLEYWRQRLTQQCRVDGKVAVLHATNFTKTERGVSWWWIPPENSRRNLPFSMK